jgi:hypothetical protein
MPDLPWETIRKPDGWELYRVSYDGLYVELFEENDYWTLTIDGEDELEFELEGDTVPELRDPIRAQEFAETLLAELQRSKDDDLGHGM